MPLNPPPVSTVETLLREALDVGFLLTLWQEPEQGPFHVGCVKDGRSRSYERDRLEDGLTRALGRDVLKTCSACEEEKPEEKFGRYRASMDGRFHRCLACESRRQREYRRRKRVARQQQEPGEN